MVDLKQNYKSIEQDIKHIADLSTLIKPLVAIRCITFNHELYIRDALEGFVKQKTNFPFVAIVHDDASTDGTADLIREYAEKYPEVIIPIYEKENQYSKKDGSLSKIMNDACRITGAKYIAFCEGDDYWIDPNKLQMQVDFLESNPDYGMCYTSFNIKEEKTGKIIKDLFRTNPKNFPKTYKNAEEFVLAKGYVAPPSWVYRSSLSHSKRIQSVDGTFVSFTHFLAISKVHAFDQSTVVYRKLENSASHSKDLNIELKRAKNLLQTQIELITQYNLNKLLIPICEERAYKSMLPMMVATNDRNGIKEAIKKIKYKNYKDKLYLIINRIYPKIMRLAYKIIKNK